MSQSKSPLHSSGVWGSLIVIITSLLSSFGVILDPEELQKLIDAGFTIWINATFLLGGIISLWGRLRASKRIRFNFLKSALNQK